MTFGDDPLPVPLFGKDNIEDGPYGVDCGSSIENASVKDGVRDQEKPLASRSAQATAKGKPIEDGWKKGSAP